MIQNASVDTEQKTDSVKLTYCGKYQNIAVLTLNRADKANAYDAKVLDCLQDKLAIVISNPTVRVMIITNVGKVFCAGADKSTLSHRTHRDAFILQSRNLFDKIAKIPWPTIAAMQGPALAGGLELALACDIRLCSASSWFGFPETELGLIPAAGGIRRLTEIVGPARAKEVILSGRQIDHSTALQWGLVTKISHDVLVTATTLAEDIQSRDTLAIHLAKMTFCALSHPMQNDAIEAISQAFLYDKRHSDDTCNISE